MKRTMGLALLLLTAAGGARAEGITVEDPWARASLGPSPNTAAYMTIRSDQPDRLTGASSPAVEAVELHATMDHAGVTTMRPVGGVEVAPDAAATLQPGGLHLMMMGLKEPLAEGEVITITLRFDEAGAIEVEVPVRGLSYRGTTTSEGSGSHHHGGTSSDGG